MSHLELLQCFQKKIKHPGSAMQEFMGSVLRFMNYICIYLSMVRNKASCHQINAEVCQLYIYNILQVDIHCRLLHTVFNGNLFLV